MERPYTFSFKLHDIIEKAKVRRQQRKKVNGGQGFGAGGGELVGSRELLGQ